MTLDWNILYKLFCDGSALHDVCLNWFRGLCLKVLYFGSNVIFGHFLSISASPLLLVDSQMMTESTSKTELKGLLITQKLAKYCKLI